MLPDSMIRPAALIGLALTLCACTKQETAPVMHAAGPDVILQRETETIDDTVPEHATLDSLLRQNQLSADLVRAAVESAAGVFNPRQLRANRPYRLVRSIDGLLREFEYQIDADRFLRIINRDRSQPAVLEAEVLPYEKDTRTIAIHATIDSEHPSLIAAVQETGENIQLSMSLAEIFSGQIDFVSDLQPGDGFEVLFEKSTRDGEFAGYGAILGARFIADGREHRAFRWTNAETGRAGYYDEQGRSLKRFMLRTPLRFEPRVTSGFSRNRLHPVFRTYRAHLGIDYAAPVGAPVVAVASGTVVSAGWAGGGGNQIRLRHPGGYESFYLHLSSFGTGIRARAHVDQGQLIGRVGATGTATGPHLDFRLRRSGVFVNPLIEHSRMPPGDPISAAYLPAFMTARDALLQSLETTLAASPASGAPDAVRAVR
jgi:murein DD-endopeptidase MepM/ murein hydrolase activator NlpD